MFELRATLSLAAIFAIRMLGLFMILPVLGAYARDFEAANSFLIGLTLGIYGLTQASLQIIFGWLSDKIGRKPVITLGLGFFILGSLIAAFSTSIYGLLIGRALQGAAAIGSVVLALLSDLVLPEKRSQSMAIIGVVIALTFGISLILGPFLNAQGGMSRIFEVSAFLGVFAVICLWGIVPQPPVAARSNAIGSQTNSGSHRDLFRLNSGVFIIHASLTSLFVALPVVLQDELKLETTHEWRFYLPVITGAFFISFLLIPLAERVHQVKQFILAALIMLAFSFLGCLSLTLTLPNLSILLGLFFVAFTFLEATLPAAVSKIAPAAARGTAMGFYSTLQFLGIFVGGSLGGVLFAHFGFQGVVGFCLILSLLGTAVLFPLKKIV